MMALARPVVLGNWKMNGLRAEGLALAGALADKAARLTGTLGVFPPATILAAVARRLEGSGIMVGAQDCHERASGAFTGSISAAMLKDAGAQAVILGHSERRHGLGEGDALVRAKAAAALDGGLRTVVVCVGETEQEWLDGKTLARLDAQLQGSIPDGIEAERLIVAYEPVWAIGTGRTPEPSGIEAVHRHLRGRLEKLVSGGASVPILYGGSVKAANAGDILAQRSVDGALVGGASLEPREFWAIYQAGGGA
jgi:triosephosphate isomerase